MRQLSLAKDSQRNDYCYGGSNQGDVIKSLGLGAYFRKSGSEMLFGGVLTLN